MIAIKNIYVCNSIHGAHVFINVVQKEERWKMKVEEIIHVKTENIIIADNLFLSTNSQSMFATVFT